MKIECTPNELTAAGDEFLRLHARRQERGWSIMKLMIAAGLNPHNKLGNAMVGLPETLEYRGAKFTYTVMSAAIYELQGIPRAEWEQQERRPFAQMTADFIYMLAPVYRDDVAEARIVVHPYTILRRRVKDFRRDTGILATALIDADNNLSVRCYDDEPRLGEIRDCFGAMVQLEYYPYPR